MYLTFPPIKNTLHSPHCCSMCAYVCMIHLCLLSFSACWIGAIALISLFVFPSKLTISTCSLSALNSCFSTHLPLSGTVSSVSTRLVSRGVPIVLAIWSSCLVHSYFAPSRCFSCIGGHTSRW